MPPIVALPPYARLRDYEIAIRLAGGEPRVLAIGRDDPDEVIRTVDAVLLPGGGDVDPAYYDEPRHPTFEAVEAGRDELEIALANKARDVDMPLLAICRGLQLLNVARGGSLIQDIPDQVPDAISHQRRQTPDTIAHEVRVEAGSRLAGLLPLDGEMTVPVNSRHHQAIKRLGEGLVVSAAAPDGIIEAVEDRSRRFCLAVQWHPENFHRTGAFSELFAAFVKAAGERRR